MGKKKLTKAGTKVYHKLHGPGEILGPTEDPTGVMVRFDDPILKWGTDTLEVSSSLLTKRWGKMAGPKANSTIQSPEDNVTRP